MKFKVGDLVETTKAHDKEYKKDGHLIGIVAEVGSDDDTYPYITLKYLAGAHPSTDGMSSEFLRLVSRACRCHHHCYYCKSNDNKLGSKTKTIQLLHATRDKIQTNTVRVFRNAISAVEKGSE